MNFHLFWLSFSKEKEKFWSENEIPPFLAEKDGKFVKIKAEKRREDLSCLLCSFLDLLHYRAHKGKHRKSHRTGKNTVCIFRQAQNLVLFGFCSTLRTWHAWS
jgi:hypothetical protein